MKIIAILLFWLLYTVTVPIGASQLDTHNQAKYIAQNQLKQGPVFSSADRDELIRLATLDGLNLSKPGWTHKEVAICPTFTHHVFIQYKDTGMPNADFIAVYPRTIGNIHIVRLGVGPTAVNRFASIRPATISTFNAILVEERRDFGFTMPLPKSVWINLASCYAELAGEQPAQIPKVPSTEDTDKTGHIDVARTHVLLVGIEVLGNPSKKTNLSIEFDRSGLIRHVIRSESNAPSNFR